MRRIKFTLTAVCAATLLTAAVAAAQGTLADRKTIVTFSGPVSVPGTTLPAGTYVFRIADSPANRNIVQIFDRDEAKLITTLLAVPAERAEAEGDPVVTFKETPSDRPPAVRYWYYAGEKAGNELVYPRSQAVMIARNSGQPVWAIETDASDIEGLKKGEMTKVMPDASAATTAPTTTAPEPTPAPARAPVTTEPTPQNPPVSAAPTQPEQPEKPVGTSGHAKAGRLPKTASELPAVGLIGLLALAGALTVRAARRSIA
jgi:hypothetical protein